MYAPFGVPMKFRNGLVISSEGQVMGRDDKVMFDLKNGECIDKYGYVTIQ